MTTAAAIAADFREEPWLHQLKEFERSAELPARALLWQMRTGKSKVVVDTACHLAKAGKIDAVLVFAPNGVHENWTRRQLPQHHWNTVPRRALAWRTSVAGTAMANPTGWVSAADRERWREEHKAFWAEVDRMLSGPELAWMAFNTESMTRDDVRALVRRVVRRRRFMAVFDESDDFRTPGSARTKMARAVAKRAAFRRILTGTVVENSPLAAYSQFELLEPGALGHRTFGSFKKRHAVYELARTRDNRSYPRLDHYDNLDELTERMARWSSVVLRDDCEDLPDVITTTRRIDLTDEQRRVYRELLSSFCLDLDGVEVSVGDEGTSRLNKLQQVGGGFLIDEYRDVHDIPGPNPRLEALSDEVMLAAGKVIVWCHYKEDIRRAVERLTADGHVVVQYHGDVGDEEKQRSIDRFQNDRDVKALVGQPRSGGRGLDLSAADEIINYSHTFDAIAREQSSERATEVAGANVRMVDFVAPGVDEYVRERVSAKISIADDVARQGMREVLKRCEI